VLPRQSRDILNLRGLEAVEVEVFVVVLEGRLVVGRGGVWSEDEVILCVVGGIVGDDERVVVVGYELRVRR
jgi:hypothetical protein